MGKNGILAENGGEGFAEGTALSITSAGAVSGSTNGIEADNFGTGDLTITATDADDGTGVSGGMFGISAVNQSGGVLSIAADNVRGENEDGIYANNDADGSSLTITTTGDVQGGQDGIEARNDGSGNLTITATNGGAASVTGDDEGIYAYNDNGGNLSVTADNVTGTYNDGIYAYNYAGTVDLSITTYGNVTGGTDGIDARNDGSGDLTVEVRSLCHRREHRHLCKQHWRRRAEHRSPRCRGRGCCRHLR